MNVWKRTHYKCILNALFIDFFLFWYFELSILSMNGMWPNVCQVVFTIDIEKTRNSVRKAYDWAMVTVKPRVKQWTSSNELRK